MRFKAEYILAGMLAVAFGLSLASIVQFVGPRLRATGSARGDVSRRRVEIGAGTGAEALGL